MSVPEGLVHNADSDLKRLAGLARGIVALEEEVARLGGLSQAISETQARLDALKVQEEGVRQKIVEAHAAAQDEIKAKLSFADDAVSHKHAQADEKVAAAGAQAQQVIEQAQGQADQIVAEAKGEAARIVDEAHKHALDDEAKVTAAQATLAQLDNEIASARATLASLGETLAGVGGEISQAVAKKDEIAGHIAALKAKF